MDYDSFEHHNAQVDGLDVHWVEAGSGPTIVLVHGSPLSSFSFRVQIDRLRHKYRVLAPDLVGFGRSEKPEDGADFLLLRNVMRSWMDAHCPDRFALLGHDWGGPSSIGAASLLPEQLTHLILLNTTIRPDFAPPGYWKGFTAPGVGDALVVTANVFGRGLPLLLKAARTRSVRRQYREAFKSRGARKTALRLERQEGFVEVTTGIAERLGKVDIPKLILWGEPDPYFREGELDQLVELLPGARVEKLPGAGHFPQEDAAEAVADHLEAFLSS